MTRIVASGSYLPPHTITNHTLATSYQLETSDEWIRQRTGIKQRHFAENESIVDMAVQASKKAMSQANIQALEIKIVVVASMSTSTPTPSIACQVQAEIGADVAYAFDLSAACSGFVYGLQVANSLMLQETCGYALVIGAEKMSQVLDFTDRSTAVLFGDGAGAVIIEADHQASFILKHELNANGALGSSLVCGSADVHSDFKLLEMQGREIFNFVQRKVIPSCQEFLNKAEVDVSAVDYFFIHQANDRLLELWRRKLQLSSQQVPANIDQVANLSAASIPVLMDQTIAVRATQFKGDKLALLGGFGGGLTWGNLLIKL